ncbi:dTDP-4-dehydrorhamnose reductase [Desulfurispirillum indicum S5]|uniref:dTDP-4-dehydrorhamnose reductase n=1 Tax=Desulfurispirillum indicum (strain ATCC BAA-1389 / DSM 22839 / S5) TaxID=653733 RepID=E6W5A0_DESIS|nr:dTDP-4-dehydrorhamnose reductase [Desulfurispirillum indicum]ADU67179.1 dTDP-4-dehydrorhamnose reductase [Desulfurispirillum indicum S5]
MSKILVTGGHGQLGGELSERLGPACISAGREVLDVTAYGDVERFCRTYPIAGIVNCAAYTAVDAAESECENAFRINEKGAAHLARISGDLGIPFIHISTDFVFDGTKTVPYVEGDVPNPLGVYGASKLAGEEAVMSANDRSTIVRTSWLYSSRGKNFVKTILQHASRSGQLRVVDDQVGSPTYAGDLADMLVRMLSCSSVGGGRVFHFANEGVCSWYDFACAITAMAGIKCDIEPIETSEYPLPAKRPHYSVLNKRKIKTEFGVTIPYWRNSLERCISRLKVGCD